MLVVVGGHSRSIGKTAVMCGIIRGTVEANWTAIKITQHGHGVCSQQGEACGCDDGSEHPFAVSEETAATATDSGRYVAAGARRSLWVRTAVGDLGHAVPSLRDVIDAGGNVIVESNSILDFFVPDLYLAVLDFTVTDMKDSARRFLDRANGLVITSEIAPRIAWPDIPARWLRGKRAFLAPPPAYESPELAAFVRDRYNVVSPT